MEVAPSSTLLTKAMGTFGSLDLVEKINSFEISYEMYIVFFVILIIIFGSLGLSYNLNYGKFRSDKLSVDRLLSLRRTMLGTSVDPLTPNISSISASILNKKIPYNTLNDTNIALLQWRPLTVRLAGYLGSESSVFNGVFDMLKGIQAAISLGARSFIFDIDYLNEKPCNPCVIYRDSGGNRRSLNTGSIRDAMTSLNSMAFSTNYDPVVIVLYLRRIPSGKTQKKSFFTAISAALDPIGPNHLGLTEKGSFHSCISESILFQGDITSYQKKFIVLCNYDTTLLTPTRTAKDNLNFWVNARLFLHPLSTNSSLGSVSRKISSGGVAYAHVGSTSDFLTISDSSETATTDFLAVTRTTYTIALGPVDEILSVSNLNILLNTLGIHCVPIDVIRLAESKSYVNAIRNKKREANLQLADLSSSSNSDNPLSYWIYGGWSRFLNS